MKNLQFHSEFYRLVAAYKRLYENVDEAVKVARKRFGETEAVLEKALPKLDEAYQALIEKFSTIQMEVQNESQSL